MIRGAIFAVDATLVDTERYQWQGWADVLKPLGIDLSKEDYFEYAGNTGNFIEEALQKRFRIDAPKGQLLSEKERLLLEWFRTKPLKAIPYAKEAVTFFLDRKIPVAVASGAPRDEVILKLKRVGLYPLLEKIVSKSDVRRGKPFPDIYLSAAQKLGLRPGECIAFEDTQYGVESASSAGLACLAVPNEFSERQDFSKAVGVFPGMKKAIEYVKKTYGL